MEHWLKTWPVYFQALWDGRKTFEIRKNDRDFKPHDILVLKEWNPETGMYSGRSITATVTYICNLPEPLDAYVGMQINISDLW